MNSSPISHQTSTRGFTFAELMVSLVLVSALGLMIFSVLISTMTLAAQNAVTNMSNFRARQTLDRMSEIVRFAQDTPVLVNADGSIATGITADGLLVKNGLGGPYVFKNTSGQADADIPAGATSFQVAYAASAGLDVPKVGDYFLLGLSTQPELEVTSVGTPTTGAVAKVQITTRTGLPDVAKPGSYTVTGSRYRKEAYIFGQAGGQWNLRYYPRVTSTTSYASLASYRNLGTGFQKLGNQAWFTRTTDNGTQACWLRAVARSSNHAEYTDTVSGRTTLSTMPVQIKLWNYNAPPPPP